ncbi:hypothetical protein TNCV_4200121 [Trichonephila clavipes]|uniref:Uncharacterized protein n=1 Tax=Trichonephila clavipes TaxID=2585209 RepID=A0A8X6WCG2_TRICX|nr:hypothetical protein TNCV_4200121 [Trichonephila clavipes]
MARLICLELKRPPAGVVWWLGEGDASSGVAHDTCPWFKTTWSVAKRPRAAEQCDVNIHLREPSEVAWEAQN